MSKNLLEHETSPYLLQHKDNPIWWKAWNSDAFNLAAREDKPIFLSIGYSTCHWCHVMEKDSFEKQDVAKILNDNFVSIKVDREERPDVDSLFMQAVLAIHGHGGWPMTVLLKPDATPFWGATFVPHDQLLGLLGQISQIWKTDRNQILNGAKELSEFLAKSNRTMTVEGYPLTPQPLKTFFQDFQSRYDSENGGFQGAPKFPQATALQALLRIHQRTQNPKALEMVTHTLKQMRRGGIFDQIGFGFHRYSVDDHWLIPHFEKMLYDNALLASTYLDTYLVTKDKEFLRVAEEILEYVQRDLTGPQGEIFSAEDADSENIEGKFYVWDESQLQGFEQIQKTYQLGLFHAHKTGDEVGPKRNSPPALTGSVFFLESTVALPNREGESENLRLRMLQKRSERPRPLRDDKVLVSWSSLMISAYAKAFRVTQNQDYLQRAITATKFIQTHLLKDGELLRSHSKGKSKGPAMSEDYSFFIQALLDLYESDFDPKWLELAITLQSVQDRKFLDSVTNTYFDSDGSDPHLMLKQRSFDDGVTPSAQSVSCMNLLRLSDLTGDLSFSERAHKILINGAPYFEKAPISVTNLLCALDRITDSTFEIAIAGAPSDPEVQLFLNSLNSRFFPNRSLAVGTNDQVGLLRNRKKENGQVTFYVCLNQTCSRPTNSVETALQLLDDLD